MASVFLSYDREDAVQAAAIAAALEKAGHSVWWDRHIRGGAQYSKAIEQALKDAHAVVVLWSERSADSAWVRDEAAAGRDTGRLVPVRLDGSEPPLGFRQYQTVDLSQWRSRARSPALQELLDAIAVLDLSTVTAPGAGAVAAPARKSLRQPLLIAVAAVVLISIVAAILLWRSWNSSDSTPTVAIVASGDSEQAKAFAENLLVQLGSLQAARADELELVEPNPDNAPDFTFKVGSVAGSSDPRATLSFIDSDAGALLWSREFAQPSGNHADLRQQLAYSAAQVLRCATEALSSQGHRIGLATLKLYLNGCAELSSLNVNDHRALVRTLRKVTEEAPRFVQGWAKLLVAETEALRQTNFTDTVLRRDLRLHIAEARKLHPTMAEAYLAEGWIQSPRPIIGWLRFSDEAVAKNPDHAGARETHSLAMMHVGRMQEAVIDARRAVQIEPLSPSARQMLVHALMDSGSIETARTELEEAERLWPGASNLLISRTSLEFRYGDAASALKLLQSGRLGTSPTPAQLSIIEARLRPSPASIGRAIADARSEFLQGRRSLSLYAQSLAQFGRKEELVNLFLSVDPRIAPGIVTALFRPEFADLRADPRFMPIAGRFGLVEFWTTTGRWPDFCLEPGIPYKCKTEAARLAAAA